MPDKNKQPLQGMELQENEDNRDKKYYTKVS